MNTKLISALSLALISGTLTACGGDGSSASGSSTKLGPDAPSATDGSAQPSAGTGGTSGSSRHATGGSAGKSKSASAGKGGSSSPSKPTHGDAGATDDTTPADDAAPADDATGGKGGGSKPSHEPAASDSAGAADGGATSSDSGYSVDDFADDYAVKPALGSGSKVLAMHDQIFTIDTNAPRWGLRIEEGPSPTVGTLNANFDGRRVWDVTKGDFNGDHVDDVAVADLLQVSASGDFACDDLRLSWLGKDGTLVSTLSLNTQTGDCYLDARMATADVNQNGKDELLVAAVKGSRNVAGGAPNLGGGALYVIDTSNGSLSITKTIPLGDSTVTRMDVTAGNFDYDPAPEIVVSYGNDSAGTVTILDDSYYDYAPIVPALYGPEGGIEAVMIGQFDDDPEPELAIVESARSLLVCEEPVHGSVNCKRLTPDLFGYSVSPASVPDDGSLEPTRRLFAVTADLDGDSRDELSILSFNQGSWELAVTNLASATTDVNYLGGGKAHLAAYNSDGDPASELLVLHSWYSDLEYAVYDPSGDPARGEAPRTSPYLHWDDISCPNQRVGVPFAVGGDFTGQNTLVRYTGEDKLALANPIVVAALAAPPVEGGIDQNYHGSETRFGQEQSTGNTTTTDNSVSVGTTVSFESDEFFDLLTFDVSSSIESEVTKSQGTTTLTTTGVDFGTTADEDSVVFLGTLYHVYTYEVLAAPDPSAIGHELYVRVPVDQQTYKWTVAQFNAEFADSDTRIGAETFHHTARDVTSYPSLTELTALGSAYAFQTHEAPVGQGHSSTGLHIQTETDQSTSMTLASTVSFETGMSVGGVGFSVSSGFSSSTSAELVIGSALNFGASIGDIGDQSDYDAYRYNVGLFVHEVTRDNGASYPVVDFWTKPLGSAYH